GTDDLVGLVPLSGQEDHVAGRCRDDSALDRLGAIENDVVRNPGRTKPGLDGLRDPARFLRTWIVVRDRRAVRSLADGCAHERALARIAIAATAEHAVDLTGTETSDSGEDAREGVGGVRVVHEHGDVVGDFVAALESP